jgi:hypothetical protein
MKGERTYVSGLLATAKARLTADTWARSGAEVKQGKVCALTALAPCARLEAMVATGLLYRAIFGAKPCNMKGLAVSNWNDSPDRTLTDVHAVYDRAIDIERHQR